MQITPEIKAEDTDLNSIKREETGESTDKLIEYPKLEGKSRKIQKKREKYKKIDDNIRLQLLDAVHKKGEMLKTVSILSIKCYLHRIGGKKVGC